MSLKNPNPIDRHVGARLRKQRMACGISQEKLGRLTGVSFQQVQKYEKGVTRISSSRLHQFAAILKVPPSFFFDDTPTATSSPKALADIEEFAASREGLALAGAFAQIDNAELRRSIVSLIKQIVDQ
jgi:transcriptional regulator with XRE-family HTH domain